jgi:hypothetical protein
LVSYWNSVESTTVSYVETVFDYIAAPTTTVNVAVTATVWDSSVSAWSPVTETVAITVPTSVHVSTTEVTITWGTTVWADSVQSYVHTYVSTVEVVDVVPNYYVPSVEVVTVAVTTTVFSPSYDTFVTEVFTATQVVTSGQSVYFTEVTVSYSYSVWSSSVHATVVTFVSYH